MRWSWLRPVGTKMLVKVYKHEIKRRISFEDVIVIIVNFLSFTPLEDERSPFHNC